MVASAGALQNSHPNSKRRSSGWFRKVAKQLRMRPGYSRFIPPPSRGCWRGRRAPRPPMPNSAERTMPNNYESDNYDPEPLIEAIVALDWSRDHAKGAMRVIQSTVAARY